MSPKPSSITVATFNLGKVDEYRSMLAAVEIDVRSLDDFPGVGEVDETEMTFRGNAELKAIGYGVATGSIVLADDSGLEVAALGGRPGVLSARYGGDGTSFAQKMQLVLDQLAATGSEDRRARFVCEIAVADPLGVVLFNARGECTGSIAPQPRGEGGFGYDPIFVPEGHYGTFGELPMAVKEQISHRGRAFAQIIPYLRDYTAV